MERVPTLNGTFRKTLLFSPRDEKVPMPTAVFGTETLPTLGVSNRASKTGPGGVVSSATYGTHHHKHLDGASLNISPHQGLRTACVSRVMSCGQPQLDLRHARTSKHHQDPTESTPGTVLLVNNKAVFGAEERRKLKNQISGNSLGCARSPVLYGGYNKKRLDICTNTTYPATPHGNMQEKTTP